VEKAIEYLLLAGEKSNQNMAAQAGCGFFKQALELVESAHIALNPDNERRIHQGLASASFAVGDINTALDMYRKAIEVCQKHGMTAREMENLAGAASATAFTPMKREKVLGSYEEGISRAREVGDKGTESGILGVKGFHLAAVGHAYEGHKIILEAEAMALQTGDQRAVMRTRALRAFTERWLGNPGKAIELTEGLTDALGKSYDLGQLSGIIFNRGLSLAEIGSIEEAVAALKHGIDLCEKFGGALHLGRLYNTLGYCYSEIHHREEAWKWNLKSEGIARKLMEQYPMGRSFTAEVVANAKINMMENLLDQGNMEEAWDHVASFEEESKGADYDEGRVRWEARLDFLTSLILLQHENVDQAGVIIRKNLEISRREHMKKIEGRFLRLLGEVQVKRNESDNAIRSLSEAILILKEVGNPRQLRQAHASLASVYGKLGRGAEAKEQWGAAAEVIHKTANGLPGPELREGFLSAKPIREILANAGS
jgi:tetratricopeptide (TPR) repeat protein